MEMNRRIADDNELLSVHIYKNIYIDISVSVSMKDYCLSVVHCHAI